MPQPLKSLNSTARNRPFAENKRKELLNYARLVEIVKVSASFLRQPFTEALKNIDTFLWRVGAGLLRVRKTACATTP
jgi:hypothetical protein